MRVINVEYLQMHPLRGATLPPMTTQISQTTQTPQEISSKSHLRLKEGINIYRTPIGLRCGTARSSFAIPEKGYVRALEILSGSNADEIDIAESCGISADEYRELMWNLEEHEFLETSPSILSVTTRFQSVAKHKRRDILPDAAFSQLQKRVDALMQRTGFKSDGFFVMDGSRRSAHSNAFFTGLGKQKRVVFFDTLLKQLNASEMEAVLAHELGHFKHKHITQMMLLQMQSLLDYILEELLLVLIQPILFGAWVVFIV